MIFYIVLIGASIAIGFLLGNQIKDQTVFSRLVNHFLGCSKSNPCSCCSSTRVMFLPDESQPCNSFYNKLMGTQPLGCTFEEEQTKYKNRFRKRKPCKYNHDRLHEPPSAIIQLFKTLNDAQESIRICMYLITLKEMVKFLIHLKVTRNINIQLITNSKWDANSSFCPPRELRLLSEVGIEIKTNDEGMMHNKFAIIDDKTLISGSINWTFMAFRNNNETIMFTSQPSIVEQFSQKFNQMWDRMSAYQASRPRTQMDSSPPVASCLLAQRVPTKSINMIRSGIAIPTGDSGADSDELSDLSPKGRPIVFRKHVDTDSSREELDMSDADEEDESDLGDEEISYDYFMHCKHPNDPKWANPESKPQTYFNLIPK